MSREIDDRLARAIDALRAEVKPGDQTLARQTRRKLLDAPTPRWWHLAPRLAWTAAALVLVVAPLGWAAATGRLLPAWHALVGRGGDTSNKVPEVPQASVTREDPSRVIMPPASREQAALPQAQATTAAGSTATATREPHAPRVKPDKAQQLFAAAHELHFRGGEPARALDAWDAYLAFAPGGAFAVEARYNRALALLRLGRRDEALLALGPFAAGQVVPAGYRQREAVALIEALAKLPRNPSENN